MVDPAADTSTPETDAAASRLTLVETSVGDTDRDLTFAAIKAVHMARMAGITGKRVVESIRTIPTHQHPGDLLPYELTAPHGYVAITYVWH